MDAISLDGAVGWFHPAASGRGVVIVGAYGYEDLCSRVTLRELADGLAASGLPTLRLEPRDTGDADDLAPGADRIAAWIDDVRRAAGWMRRETGVSEIALVGLRIGALIAAQAASDLGDVDRLVLMAPPVNGKAHRRELSILARLVDGPSGGVLADGAIEIAGFRLEAATLDTAAAIDLTALDRRPAREVTIVGEVGSVAVERIGTALTGLGARVETLPFAGYARMMCDPTASEPALDMVAHLVARLSADLPTTEARRPAIGPARLVGDGWVEERFVFGDGLAGVLTRPEGPGIAGRSAIWLNSGRNHHIGWARQTVETSRRLARAGVAVLRMDLAGIGDSPAHAHTPPAALYHDGGGADVAAALDEMARRGHARPWVMGACSGAYRAFHSAVEDPRIAGIVLVNQLCFLWDASYAVHLSAWMRARPHEFEAEAKRAESGEAAATGGLSGLPWRLAKKLVRVGLDLYRKLALAGSARRPGPIEAKFRALSARGCAVSVVITEGDKSVSELELHTGPDGERIAGLPGVEILRLTDSDHSLSPKPARDRLAHHLVARLAGAEAPTITSSADVRGARRPAPAPDTRRLATRGV